MRSKDAFQKMVGSQKYEFMKALVPWCHAVVKTCRKCVSLWIKLVKKNRRKEFRHVRQGPVGEVFLY
jgi:hypothetical protein